MFYPLRIDFLMENLRMKYITVVNTTKDNENTINQTSGENPDASAKVNDTFEDELFSENMV